MTIVRRLSAPKAEDSAEVGKRKKCVCIYCKKLINNIKSDDLWTVWGVQLAKMLKEVIHDINTDKSQDQYKCETAMKSLLNTTFVDFINIADNMPNC